MRGIPLLGIGVRAPKEKQEENVFALAQTTAEKLGCPGCGAARRRGGRQRIMSARAMAFRAADTLEAIRMFAELEGILLDPVYSGKGAAGLIDYCRKGRFKKGERIVFLHTGGSAALFGYDAVFERPAHRRLVGHGAAGSHRRQSAGPPGRGSRMRRSASWAAWGRGDGPADAEADAAVPPRDDADHIPLIVDQNPQVPSRIRHLIEGTGRRPRPGSGRDGPAAGGAGAEALAMPCNTAHHYAPRDPGGRPTCRLSTWLRPVGQPGGWHWPEVAARWAFSPRPPCADRAF